MDGSVFGTCRVFKMKPTVVEAFQAPLAMSIDGMALLPGDWGVIKPDGHCVKFTAQEFKEQFDPADGEIPTRLIQKAPVKTRVRRSSGTRKVRGMAPQSGLANGETVMPEAPADL